jgi:serine protease Do
MKAAIETVPVSQLRVGQWTIAVGRTFEGDRPNMAVGILSAINRVWGKAIQTDAAVSPNNYGGPLVDIRGRVLGVLVPLSPDAADEMAGVEWYDSGIGFAIPIEQIQKVLPRLKKGEDLYPGRAGFSLKDPNVYTGEPIIGVCVPKSPALAAGIKPNDKIIEIDGRKIVRSADVKEALGRHYAGDKVPMVVLRDKAPVPCEVTLVAKLEPFQHGFLGILPMRTPETNGVTVRYVYPDSPAAKADIAPGDTIRSLQGQPVASRGELMLKVGATEPGASIELEVARGDTVRKVKVTLVELPDKLPPDRSPPAVAGDDETPADERPQTGDIRLKVPEVPNDVWAYVPQWRGTHWQYGVVVWLHGPGGFDWPELLLRWKPICDRFGLILVAPKSVDSARWSPREAALVDRLLVEIGSRYKVDPARIVVHGHENGGALAFLAAFRNRASISAVAAVEATPTGQPPDNDPLSRLAVYVATSGKSPVAPQVEAAVAVLRRMKIPVTVKGLGDVPRYLNPNEMAELARWIDMLDRI